MRSNAALRADCNGTRRARAGAAGSPQDAMPLSPATLSCGKRPNHGACAKDRRGELRNWQNSPWRCWTPCRTNWGWRRSWESAKLPAACRGCAYHLKARSALEIGRLFHQSQHPRPTATCWRSACWPACPPGSPQGLPGAVQPGNQKLFNTEMLETIRAFIRRNLNLTDAARDALHTPQHPSLPAGQGAARLQAGPALLPERDDAQDAQRPEHPAGFRRLPGRSPPEGTCHDKAPPSRPSSPRDLPRSRFPLAGACPASAMAAETVTIPKEEYDRLKRYELLDESPPVYRRVLL